MKVVALVSGGKDSCYAMMKCIDYGHEVVALANLMPSDESVDELNSYMYQTVGHQIVSGYAKCMGIPLFRRRIRGYAINIGYDYTKTVDDEVEDMCVLLSEVKAQIPAISGVCSGAIASDYQRLRVESVCSRLGLVSLAYLWKQDQSILLKEMISNGIIAIIVKVASLGLDPEKHIGMEIKAMFSYLQKLQMLYGVNVCGEGGEYESLTLDCPLFYRARIVLDSSLIVSHSLDSIAPVAVLHPIDFHIEEKEGFDRKESFPYLNADNTYSNITVNETNKHLCDNVYEVKENTLVVNEIQNGAIEAAPFLILNEEYKSCIVRTEGDPFTMCCWLENSCQSSRGFKKDVELVLRCTEHHLFESGFGWENVLYVHLYISDMNEFSSANEVYMKYITELKCPNGVPSRVTVELPLSQLDLGHAYIEILVTSNHNKKVLHVRSISCWAPGCIGPYSQATLHNDILYMAGQLGLDPPTMTICNGGANAELFQALRNSEEVAKCFGCSLLDSTVLLIIYCSINVPLSERENIHEALRLFLVNESNALTPVVVYVLVPDLPKRAFVEVKPILCVNQSYDSEKPKHNSSIQYPEALAQDHLHDSCFQKCIIHGKLCVVVVHITTELCLKICSDICDSWSKGQKDVSSIDLCLPSLARFCINLLDKIITENGFYWKEIMSFRLYIPVTGPSLSTASRIFRDAFDEFQGKTTTQHIRELQGFNIIPVLGSGMNSTSFDDVMACELIALR